MDAAYIAIFILALGGFWVVFWALTKVVRAERYPKVLCQNGRLSLCSEDDSAEYDLGSIDRFKLVTTYYFSASGNTSKRALFVVNANGLEKLIYSKDPENMIAGPFQKFLAKLEATTGKRIEHEEFVEDLDGRRYTMQEFKKKRPHGTLTEAG